MPANALTLYADQLYASPYAMSVFVALVEKKLPFELKTVDLAAGRNLEPAFRELALTTRVPALLHDGFTLSESSAIVEYLEDVFAAPDYAPVLPRDPRERARARQIQAWLRSDLMPIRNERNTLSVFVAPVTTPLSSEAKGAADKLFHAVERLIDGSNLFEHWCIADTDLALMLQRLILNGDPVPQKLQDYARGQWQRASVQQWLPKARGPL